MSGYKDLFNINQLTDLETLNSNEAFITTLSSDNFSAESSDIKDGIFETINCGTMSVSDCNINNNLNFHYSSTLSKGDYVYTLQDKTGVIAFLDDIKTPENMVTTNTDQKIAGQKRFEKSIILDDGIINGLYNFTFTSKSGRLLIDDDIVNMVVKDDLKSYALSSNVIDLLTDQNNILGKKTFINELTVNSLVNCDSIKIKNGSFQFYDKVIYYPLQSGALVVWGDLNDYVTKNTSQTIDGMKTFSLRTKFVNGFNNGTYDVDLQNKAGTLALTSDLDNYVTLDNVNQTISGYKTFSNLVTFQNGISNGLYNYTFTSKSGRLLIDDDIKNVVVQDDIKDMVVQNDILDVVFKDDIKNVVVQDDIKNMVIQDDIKDMVKIDDIKDMVVKDDIINMVVTDDIVNMVVKDDIINMVVTDDIVNMVVKDDIINMVVIDDIKDMVVADDLKNYVTLSTNQTITGIKEFTNAVITNLTSSNINCNGNLEINGGNSKACSNRYTDLNASVSKIIHLDFGSNYSFSFSGKIMITGYVEQNKSKVFYLEYLVWGGRNGPYGDWYNHELIHQKDNTSSNKFVTFGFDSIANNYVKYLVSTRSTTTKTSFIINCDITYFSDASGNLTIRFVDA